MSEKEIRTNTRMVTSKDGTSIAYEKSGRGPALILVGGALEQRAWDSETAQLAALPQILEHLTVYHYDRRGRGGSSDTQPYDVQREIEDIEALIDEAGGQAYLYGISSGAALAFEAALALQGKVKKLAMYEPPYNDDVGSQERWREYRRALSEVVAEGKKGEAVDLFMMLVGLPREQLGEAHAMPMWQMLEEVGLTLAYDAAVMGEDSTVPIDRAARLINPALVMAGGESFPFMRTAAEALAKAMPQGEFKLLEGQTHELKAEAVSPVLAEFFTS